MTLKPSIFALSLTILLSASACKSPPTQANKGRANKGQANNSPTNKSPTFNSSTLTLTARAPLTVAIIGDYGDRNPAADDVAKMVASWRPQVVATVGDNNYPAGAASTIDDNIGRRYGQFIKPYRGRHGAGSADVNRFFPSLGNHDWYTPGARPYLEYFQLPGNERYYDVRIGQLHLFFVDSDRNEPDGVASYSRQGRWLKGALKASQAPHRWVLFHHPPFNTGRHRPAHWMRWPFKEWGATAVFSGHDHHYERLVVGGLTYIVTGHGGRHLYPASDEVAKGSVVRVFGRYGAVRARVDSNGAIVCESIARDGAVLDRFTLPASPRAPSGG